VEVLKNAAHWGPLVCIRSVEALDHDAFEIVLAHELE
jgi:hypothetical protein